tara:strand:+ start:105 stop:575 length:471 start_codon:yes stop_codon:yes gene_type:complete
MHAKIENGQVVSYPYRHLNLRKDNPSVSFPNDSLDRADIQSTYGIVSVQEVSVPVDDGFVYTEGTPFLDGSVWKQSWDKVEKPTARVQSEENEVVIRKRLTQYGPASNQIEFITENGLEAWQTKVAEIKASLPKPHPDASPWSPEMDNNPTLANNP